MKKSFVVIWICVVGFAFFGKAQTALDGAYVPEHNPTRRVVPYPHLRQADVMWKRRIWERIDLKQKMNFSLYYPTIPIKGRYCLFDLIRQGILDGQITAYNTTNAMGQNDDEFTNPLTAEQIQEVYYPKVAEDSLDENGEKVGLKYVTNELKSDKVLMYELKEDWIFDKQRSERYVRIIGIAPVVEKKLESGIKTSQTIFWLYFPECRYLFANADVFNLHNNSQPITFDDLFQKRMFNAFVVKEENVYDRKIAEYFVDPMKQILESERIKEDLFLFEHDLWHY
jgi:gliding motility associated protien GldN